MAAAPHRFDAGRVSLDLLATLGNRSDERLTDPAALEQWMRAGGLVDGPCDVEAQDLVRARALRTALFGVVDALLRGDVPRATDVEEINAAATAPTRAPRMELDGDRLRSARRAPTVVEVLGEIARDAVDLLTGTQRALMRECAAEDCSGIYVDTSRGGTRRWCSTERCGNRARVAAHRARHAAREEARSR
jgi:predicted RNA-binding Zn ribbon-like protein